MKKIYPIAVAFIFFSCDKGTDNTPPPTPPVLRDAIYNNGPLATGATSNSGVTAPSGYQWSEAQHNTVNTTVTNSVIGFACHYSASSNYKAADDFTIPAGQTWNISRISVYANGIPGGTGPFDAIRIQIWNGKPSLAGSTIVYGDLSTNLLSASLDSMLHPILNSSVPAPGLTPTTSETIWKLSATINTTLPAGNYWLVYQVHKINNGDVYSPPVKIKGSRGLTGWNAIVFNSLNVWQALDDSGNPFTPPRIPQDLPFEIVYKY